MSLLPTVIASEPALAWGVAAALLGAAELIAPGFSLIWLGAAAAVTAAATALLGLAAGPEFAMFAAAAIGSIYLSRRMLASDQSLSDDPFINERPARLIGRSVTVVEPLIGGHGRVRLGDTTWLARGPDLPEGVSAQVIAMDGGTLVVIATPAQRGDLSETAGNDRADHARSCDLAAATGPCQSDGRTAIRRP